jgi:hypothetical protein
MTGIAARNGVITGFAPARRSSCKFWGQVLGTESAAALPREATRIALTPQGRGVDASSSFDEVLSERSSRVLTWQEAVVLFGYLDG